MSDVLSLVVSMQSDIQRLSSRGLQVRTAENPLRLVTAPRALKNPRPGVRRDLDGCVVNPPHGFRSLGRARLWKGGIAGPWFVIASEDPRPDGGLR